jgi:hypothetical protein
LGEKWNILNKHIYCNIQQEQSNAQERMARTKKVNRAPMSESDSEPSLSTSIENTGAKKSGRKMTGDGALFKAKWLFYNDNKSNQQIIDEWIEKRKNAGLPYQKPKVANKKVIMVPDINFLDIKDATDILWEKQNAREQKKYIDKAWELHNEKASKDEH